ncbi:MAG: tetratricopeptide repeat protein [Acidobacteria bacterium]|nr:tetratricopeptide repeat protein [Acidobacteriota bacterium]
MPWALLLSLLLLASCRKAPTPPPTHAYVDAKLCAGCHAEIAKNYSRSGMAQAFYKATPDRMQRENWTKGNEFYHAPSERYYRMSAREGKYFLRRWQKGPAGAEENVLEAEIHYVMGSGNAARSYLHRTPQGRLAELPVAWYAEKGGYFAMSPGYDRPDHQGFRRKISTDCMFCHNAYPANRDVTPASEPLFAEKLPEGIDCQRCHGPGRAHVEAATANQKDAARAAIVNPARLSADRSFEVCMQCHLETTSLPLPNSLVRFGRGAFSYDVGKPLSDFLLHFDHGEGRKDKFEIVSSVYRLRQSACFLKSGKMQCTTCHDAHRPAREDMARIQKACQQCHSGSLQHAKGGGCASCHMPKRRTEDVVHASVTDHKIQRKPELAKPMAELKERHERPGDGYSGEVVLYPSRTASGEEELYLALAQVVQRSNLKPGIARLEKMPLKDARSVFGLAQAYAVDGQHEKAVATYRTALALDPQFVPAMRNLGELLHATGKPLETVPVLERAKTLAPENASVAMILGQAYRDAGRLDDALSSLRKAVELDPDFAEAHNSLGLVLMEKNDTAGAMAALREALRHRPDFADARSNLGNAFAVSGQLDEAINQHKAAIRLAPDSASAHFNYAAALMGAQRFADAEKEMEATVRLRPNHAEAQEALGSIAASRGGWLIAIRRYEAALKAKPNFDRALLGMGSALAATGNGTGAREYLRKAAAAGNADVRREAEEVLRMLSASEPRR